MSEVTVYKQAQLPATMEELSKFVLIGREKLVAVRAEIRAIDKVGLAQEVRKQKLSEAQDIAEAVMDAEAKVGELMKQIPKASGGNHGNQYTGGKNDNAVVFAKSKEDVIREAGFTPKQVQRFETLAAHPEVVAQAKAEARENDDIVSRSFVLEKIKSQKKESEMAEIRRILNEQRSQTTIVKSYATFAETLRCEVDGMIKRIDIISAEGKMLVPNQVGKMIARVSKSLNDLKGVL